MNLHPTTYEDAEHILSTYQEVTRLFPNQYRVDFYYLCLVVSDGEELNIQESLWSRGEANFRGLFEGTPINSKELVSKILDENWEGVQALLLPFIALPELARESFEIWEAVVLGFEDKEEEVIERILEIEEDREP